MPSAHAQFMAFYTTYILLWMTFRVRYFSTLKKLSRGAGLLILSATVSYARVYLHYHSAPQVLVGVGAGIVCGIGWFIAVVFLRDLGIVDLLLDTYPARFFYIKDTAGEKSSFVRDEYSEWRRMRMKMKLLIKVE
jgi:dolichyldiphosphatase